MIYWAEHTTGLGHPILLGFGGGLGANDGLDKIEVGWIVGGVVRHFVVDGVLISDQVG